MMLVYGEPIHLPPRWGLLGLMCVLSVTMKPCFRRGEVPSPKGLGNRTYRTYQ